jgi:hypothetical protein
VHPAINVRGSRYALVIEDLEPQDFKLDLAKTRVAIGNSEGRSGDAYVKGRVDKACLEVTSAPVGKESKLISIGLVARLREPYALYIRNSESD